MNGDRELGADGPGRAPRAVDVGSDLARGALWVGWSFLVVSAAANLLVDVDAAAYWLIMAAWLASGTLAWWPAAEPAAARWVFGLTPASIVELHQLGPLWAAVTDRAGVPGDRYALWVADAGDELSVPPRTGRVVAVTRAALYVLPDAHLEAVLAHVLGHVLGGRDRVRSVLLWWSLPARAVAVAARRVKPVLRRVPALGCLAVGAIAAGLAGLLLSALLLGRWGDLVAWLVVIVVTAAAGPMLGWLDRRDDLRADRAAADLGYGPRLLETLYGWQARQIQTAPASRPTVAYRIAALERQLSPTRPHGLG
ncbi:MAG TPA: M48 family metalloprotease [Kribbellaceae bacterium]